MSSSLKAVSLYSGAGGLDYGFKLAGFETLFANDLDPLAVESFNTLVGPGIAHAGDIDQLKLPDAEGVDVVIGGPPCQGFSVAGKMNPNDPRSKHVWRFLEVVSTLKPRCFVMENVKSLAVNERWAGLRDGLLLAATSMGYSTRLFVLKASDYGVPQNRERMFLIGCLEGVPVRPQSSTADSRPASRLVFESLPAFGTRGNDRAATAKITLASRPVLRRSPFAGMLFNGAGRPINFDAPAPTLPASMGGNKTPIVDQYWLENGGASHWVKDYHARLWAGGEPLPWKDVPTYLRRLTAEEAAALQTFPIGFEWAGPTSAVFRQIGNAVPPMLAKAVADSVRELLVGDSADTVVRLCESVPTLSAERLASFADSPQLLLV